MPDVVVAAKADLEQMLGLAARKRAAYARHQPRFWRPASDAVDRQRASFSATLDDEEAVVVVARTDGAVEGFGIGRLVAAPPVYDPGGATCVVDDLAVDDPDRWNAVGALLLDAIRTWARSHGAAQLVVVTARLDDAERAVLAGDGLTVASEWWVGATDR